MVYNALIVDSKLAKNFHFFRRRFQIRNKSVRLPLIFKNSCSILRWNKHGAIKGPLTNRFLPLVFTSIRTGNIAAVSFFILLVIQSNHNLMHREHQCYLWDFKKKLKALPLGSLQSYNRSPPAEAQQEVFALTSSESS